MVPVAGISSETRQRLAAASQNLHRLRQAQEEIAAEVDELASELESALMQAIAELAGEVVGNVTRLHPRDGDGE